MLDGREVALGKPHALAQRLLIQALIDPRLAHVLPKGTHTSGLLSWQESITPERDLFKSYYGLYMLTLRSISRILVCISTIDYSLPERTDHEPLHRSRITPSAGDDPPRGDRCR